MISTETEMRLCKKCGLKKEMDCFYGVRSKDPRYKGKVYRTYACKDCCKATSKAAFSKRDRKLEWQIMKFDQVYMEQKKARRDKASAADSSSRKNGGKRCYWLLRDSRHNDRTKGRENDLTYDFLEKLISLPCFYCEDTSITVGMDRIDNSLGHLQGNVVAACVRCNLIRGDMPYEAWLKIVPAVKEARLLGLFGSWLPPVARKKRQRKNNLTCESPSA